MTSDNNHKDSSFQVLASRLGKRLWGMVFTGCLLLLLTPAFAMAANTITFVSITNNQIADGIDQDELVYQVTDGMGNPVSGQSVYFQTPSGTSKEVSDASGYVYFDLGNYSTAASVPVSVIFNGIAVPGGSFNFTWVAGPIDPSNPQTQITVDKATAQPDGSDYTQVTVHLFDAYGNPVVGVGVAWTVAGGSASGTAIISPGLSATSSSTGTSTIVIKNFHSGDVSFTVAASGVSITNGSPATVHFVATIPDPTNPLTAIIVDVPTVQPDGTSVDVVHAHIVDVNGNPVVGATVVFTVTGGTAAGTANVMVINGTTNSNGDAIINISNTKSGTVILTATVNGTSITTGSPATVNFVATTPSTTNPATAIVIDVSPVQPDGTTQDILHANIVDVNGNPITGATVVFTVTGGTASGTAVVSAVTDNGYGTYTIDVTNTKAGTVIFTATVNGVSITNGSPATVSFVATTPSTTNPATAIIVDVPTSPPDGTSQDIVHAHIVDANGNPVSGASVVFTIAGGTATGTATVSSVTDNGNGDYTIDITNTKSGTVIFTATVNGLPITNGSPATVNFVATTPSTTNPATALIVDISPSPPDGTTQDILHAHVVDVNGNPVPGVTVNFIVTGGTAAGTAVVTIVSAGVTDANGDAVVDVTNTTAGSVIFIATVGGSPITNGSPATVNFVATTPSTTNSATALIVDVPTAPDDATTPAIIHAHIVDANGNPVSGASVVFAISGGTASGTAVVSAVTDNGNGDYTIDITNSKPGTVSFTATVNGLAIVNGSPATVTFVTTPPATTNPATAIIVDVPTSPPDGVSQDIIHAHVVDGGGYPLSGQSVVFTISGGTATGTAVVSAVTDNGNGDYTIDITNTKSGTVTFTATVNGAAITNGSPATVNFVATTPSTTNPATQLVVDVPSAPDDGTTQTSIHAQVVDAGGNPVTGQTVVFTIAGGTAAGTAVVSSVTDNGDGTYTIDITNTKPGTVNFTATVNGAAITYGSPATVTFVVTAPSTTNPATQLIVDVPVAPPDGTTSAVIHAHVVDAGGSPVSGANVVFTIIGGTSTGTAVVSAVTDDGNGNYTIDITNTVSGTVSFTATVNGTPIPNGSPATVNFVANAPSTGNAQTQLIVDVPTMPADGTSQTVIHAHLVDAGGNPVPNAPVIFTISGGTAASTVVVSLVTADGNGNFTIDITNMVAGTVSFTATVYGAAITNGSPATVNFTAGTVSTSNPATKLVVDVPSATADGASQTVVHAQLVDAGGNPVIGKAVVFTISGGTAAATAVVSAVTDNGDGSYTIYITNTKIGTVSFTATANTKPIVNGSPATVTFVVGPPVPGDPSGNGPTGGNTGNPNTSGYTLLFVTQDYRLADGTQQDSVIAYVTDAFKNVVPGVSITFAIQSLPTSGTATAGAQIIGSTTVQTGANGEVGVAITSTTAGTVFVTANLNGVNLDGSYQIVTFLDAPDVTNIQTSLTVIIREALADGTQQTEVKAHVVDLQGNVMPDQPVTFSIDSGSATIISPQPVTTDANGDAYIYITSKTPGDVLITATVDDEKIVYGSPARVEFAPINIYVPKVFTPNNDGTNDVLKPILVGIQTFHYFSVYNRWGNLIFTTQDPNQGWDGTFKGVPQPVETYLWIGEGVDVNGKKIVQKGMTSLVR